VGGGISGDPRVYARERDPGLVRTAVQLSYRMVDDIGEVVEKEGIECGWDKSGWLKVATTVAQREGIDRSIERRREWGAKPDDWRLLSRRELDRYVRMPGALAGLYSPHAARVDPARFVRGLADAVERLGAKIHEATEVMKIEPGRVRTPLGTVKATFVVRATEAFTVQLPAERRRFLPLYSLMIATEPLSAEVWEEIGLEECKLVGDLAHLFFYGQRTTDDRLALGGRGAPYRLGRPISERYERQPKIVERLRSTIKSRFPAAADAKITHHWGGPLGVPRDWCQAAHLDRETGLAWAGGYSGGGVLSAHVAGRVLTDLILNRESEFTQLPWIGHTARRWEPEPIRFLAANAIVRVMESSDKAEEGIKHGARRMRLIDPFVSGHG